MNTLNIPTVDKRILLRVVLSPLVFICGVILTCVLIVFPLPILCGITFFQLIVYPFIVLLNKAGSEIEIPEPFIDTTNNTLINYVLTITLPLWLAFAVVVYFIITGKLLFITDL
jgi:hypothetical protein